MEKDFSAKVRTAIWNTRDYLPIPFWPVIYPNTTACPKCHTEIYPPSNRPDIVCLSRGIEVKEADERFDFSSISDGQREWATARMAEGFSYWLALQIGVDRVDSKSEKRKRAYLIPWASWIDLETRILELGSKSIPLIAGNHHKVLNEQALDCVRALSQYELAWIKGWVIPANHAWYQNIARTLGSSNKITITRQEGKEGHLDTYLLDVDGITMTGSMNVIIEALERGITPWI